MFLFIEFIKKLKTLALNCSQKVKTGMLKQHVATAPKIKFEKGG